MGSPLSSTKWVRRGLSVRGYFSPLGGDIGSSCAYFLAKLAICEVFHSRLYRSHSPNPSSILACAACGSAGAPGFSDRFIDRDLGELLYAEALHVCFVRQTRSRIAKLRYKLSTGKYN